MKSRFIWKIKQRLHFTTITDEAPISAVIRKLSKYDVVSFDIFDTLIFRTVDTPADVFGVVGNKIGDDDFKNKRINAEEEARNNTVCREPNINEIYAYLFIENTDIAMASELDVEQQVCVCNPYMLDIVDALLQRGKEIIIVSDMYLPSMFLRKILERCGYNGFSNVFVSNEYRASKYSGELYRQLSRDYLKGKKVVHIGDNMHSDYLMALENGWKALHYEGNRLK